MSQFNADVTLRNQDEEMQTFSPADNRMLDYDDQPYGDDNVLVIASKRRALLYSSSQL